jgi:hypothetical protein
MTDINPAKKDYTLSEDEIKRELSLIFDPQICPVCGQDHSFKNTFKDTKTSIDDLPANRISTAIPIVEVGYLANTKGGGH